MPRISQQKPADEDDCALSVSERLCMFRKDLKQKMHFYEGLGRMKQLAEEEEARGREGRDQAWWTLHEAQRETKTKIKELRHKLVLLGAELSDCEDDLRCILED